MSDFIFGDLPARTVGTPDNPRFVALDVCRVLGIRNSRDAVSRLPADEKEDVVSIDTLGGPQNMTAIN